MHAEKKKREEGKRKLQMEEKEQSRRIRRNGG
jgi:hypothetical protein